MELVLSNKYLVCQLLGRAFNDEADLSKRTVCKVWNDAFIESNFYEEIRNPVAITKLAMLYCYKKEPKLFQKTLPLFGEQIKYFGMFYDRICLPAELGPFEFAYDQIPQEQRIELAENLFDAYYKGEYVAKSISVMSYTTYEKMRGVDRRPLYQYYQVNMMIPSKENEIRAVVLTKVMIWKNFKEIINDAYRKMCDLCNQEIFSLLIRRFPCSNIEAGWVFPRYKKCGKKEIDFFLNNVNLLEIAWEDLKVIEVACGRDAMDQILPTLLKHELFKTCSSPSDILKQLILSDLAYTARSFLKLEHQEKEMKEIAEFVLKWAFLNSERKFFTRAILTKMVTWMKDGFPELMYTMAYMSTEETVEFFSNTKTKVNGKALAKKCIKRCSELPEFEDIFPKLRKLGVFTAIHNKKKRKHE